MSVSYHTLRVYRSGDCITTGDVFDYYDLTEHATMENVLKALMWYNGGQLVEVRTPCQDNGFVTIWERSKHEDYGFIKDNFALVYCSFKECIGGLAKGETDGTAYLLLKYSRIKCI